MSLYNIVQHVNESLRDYDYDSRRCNQNSRSLISIRDQSTGISVLERKEE